MHRDDGVKPAMTGSDPSSNLVRRRVVVHGAVQGVFFRDSTRRTAQQRGVAGWVANRPDGESPLVMEGSGDAIDGLRALCAAAWSAGQAGPAMVEFSREGPRSAQVDQIDESEEEPEGLSGFSVR